MLTPVYLYKGESLLADQFDLASVIREQGQLARICLEDDFATAGNVYHSPLADENLKDINAERVVRKTSEPQARWLIAAGVRTWRRYFDTSGDDCGLFLALGTVDCDENDTSLSLTEKRTDVLATSMLEQRRPLVCLALLNSSATSHIAQLTGITGDNLSVSPLLDSGFEALIEGFYSVQESRSTHVLCGGGSQKITPWHAVTYPSIWSQNDSPWFSDAAAFVVMSREASLAKSGDDAAPSAADGRLLAVARGQLTTANDAFKTFIDQQLTAASEQQLSIRTCIVACSTDVQRAQVHSLCESLNTNVLVVERHIGQTLAAACAIATNLGLLWLSQHDASSTDGVLVMGLGINNQVGSLTIGGTHD